MSDANELAIAKMAYDYYKSLGLNLDMSRGKPCKEQLDLSMELLDMVTSSTNLIQKTDYRNYGGIDGIPELKQIFADLCEMSPEEVIIGGNSSLQLMYDSVQRSMQFGVGGGIPLNKQEGNKWLCPVPGYDRHFAITEAFGFQMICVPMHDDGPDMDMVEELVKDSTVKGIWCVPKYSNPQGIVYSDQVVKRMAALKPASKDFRIYWDNAYMIHSLTEDGDKLLSIMAEAKKCGNEDMVYIFGSTSKVSFAGSGIAFIATSLNNIGEIKKRLTIQIIGPDKLNEYAHALYFKSAENMIAHMSKHRAIIKPKFEAVINVLTKNLTGIAKWNNPRGGYFISCDLPEGTAKRTIALCAEAGVKLTPAGSTYPLKSDPNDSNVRIAPTLPPISELVTAMEVFSAAAKIAYYEKKLAK